MDQHHCRPTEQERQRQKGSRPDTVGSPRVGESPWRSAATRQLLLRSVSSWLQRLSFRRRDQTPLGTLLELHQAESSRTLSAQHSAEETKAGSFASFRAVSSLLYFDFVRPPLHTSSIQLKVKRHLGNIPRFQDSRLLLAVYYKGSL